MGWGGETSEGSQRATLLACRRLPRRTPRGVVDEACRVLRALGVACPERAIAHLVAADEPLTAKLGGRSYARSVRRARTAAAAPALRRRRGRLARGSGGGERARARQLRADERGVAPPALQIGGQVVSRREAEPRTLRPAALGEVVGQVVGEIVGEIVVAVGRAIGAASRRAARRGAARAARRVISASIIASIISVSISILVAVAAGVGAPLAALLGLAAGPRGRRL